MKKLLLITFLFFALTATFASEQKQYSINFGFFTEIASLDDGEAIIDYRVGAHRYDTNLDMSNLYGLFASYRLSKHLFVYGKIAYQYLELMYADKDLEAGYERLETVKDLDSADVKGRSDIHNFTIEAGLDLRLSLYSMKTKPFQVLLTANFGFISGHSMYIDSFFYGTNLFGYSHGLHLRFEVSKFFVTSGLAWTHLYSRTYAKEDISERSKDDSLLLDYDRSGCLQVHAGIMF